MTTMRWRLRRILFLIYVGWAAFALLLVPLSAVGIVAENPLAAVLGLVLGLPWSVLLTWWIDSSSPILNFLLLALALAINAAILRYLSRRPRPVLDDEEEDEELDDNLEDEDLDHDPDDEDDWDEDWVEPEDPRRKGR
ncbi:hypothetical protein [Kaistia terrae]|uniref:Uncharacterized protein n=1 Tax=Kaistia terrae TaxID=537017 RepID=A0ABW0PPZ6_9HYPH|nr:hypothetical protein [Kaistia terrae]